MRTPSIILVEPQLGENIGAVARVMANFGFYDLRLVAPRDGWPNPKAEYMAAHGINVLSNAKIFPTLSEAIADLQHLIATSARQIRNMEIKSQTPRECFGNTPTNLSVGIMFGRERNGLTNDEITLANDLISIPVSEDCPSINVAQSVGIIAYEWSCLLHSFSFKEKAEKSPPADKNEIVNLFNHLEEELDRKKFFRVPEKRKIMVQNIRNMITRAKPSVQEIRTFRGIIRSLASDE